MSRNSTKTILASFLFASALGVHAQQWLGRTTGNYSGTYGIYNNASSISDSKYKYYFNFWGRGVNFYNNFLTYNAPIKINRWANNNYDLQYQNMDGKVDMRKDWLLETLNGKDKQFSFNQDIWGPAFMFPVSNNWNMSINTRQRSSFQMYGISEATARMAHNGLDSAGGIYTGSNTLSRNTAYHNNAFGINIQSFQELSFTLGGVLSKSEHHQWNGGATFKVLRGLGASYVKGSEFNLTATGNNSAQINGDIQYAYTDQKSIVSPFNDPYGLFSLRSKGAGAGFDLGMSYTYSSKKLKYPSTTGCNRNDKRSDYDFKFAVALNDIGGIRYNKNSNVYAYSSTTNAAVTAPSSILNGFGTPGQNGFDTIGKNIFGQIGASASNGFSTSLPTAINVQADFRLSKHLYTAVYWNQSLKGFNSTGMRSTSMLSVVPRIESRGFEFSMPLTLSENYRNFYVGAYTRIGPVFFGSDNLGGLLNVGGAGQFKGADIYGGVSFGIGHCHTWWYESKVDPVYMDSVKRDSFTSRQLDTIRIVKTDTIKVIQRDTIKITKKDTVYLNKKKNIIKTDTVYIEKVIKSKPDYEKELELKRKEEEINRRQREIEVREKTILEKEKGKYNETEAIKNCRNQNTVLADENVVLKAKVNKQDNDIVVLKKQLDDVNRLKTQQDSALLACKNCVENKVRNDAEILKLKNDILLANKKITELESEITVLKKVRNSTEVIKGSDAEKLAKAQKQLDSVNRLVIVLKSDLDNCKKNSTMNNAEIVKKAEADKTKAENDARNIRRQYDSVINILKVKTADLDNCKKNSTMNNAEIVKKAEADKAKAENDAKTVKRQNDSLLTILATKTADLENCRKNATMNNAEVVKKAEADKTKAENDARVARKQADSLMQVLAGKNVELDNCKKNSTSSDAEIVKKAEADKTKAENDAKLAKRQSDSLAQILTAKTAELETCKKNAALYDAEVLKSKKCADDAALLKLEMTEMSKNISRLNAKNYALSYKADSLINELKKCGNNGSTGDAELLKKCKDANAELEAQITKLKTTVSARENSLDSARTATQNLNKQQVELNAQISKLNTEIADLKAKAGNNNCDDLQKQLDDKNAEINKMKNDATTLQNKVNALTNQLSELNKEYSFMSRQNRICNQKLDSCVRGLNHKEPLDNQQPENGSGNGSGSGTGSGPMEGRIENPVDDVYSSSTKTSRAVKMGGQILNVMKQASEAGKTTSSGTKPAGTTTRTTTSGSTTSGSNTTENTGNTNGNTTNTTSGNNADRTSSGSAGSAVRR
jgi:hypothetical protein